MDEFYSSSVAEDIENKDAGPVSSAPRIGVYDRPERQGISATLIISLIALLLAIVFIAFIFVILAY